MKQYLQSDFIRITKKEYDSLTDSHKKLCIRSKQKGKHWQYFKPKTLTLEMFLSFFSK